MRTKIHLTYFFAISFICAFVHAQAQTNISASFVHGGINRTYSFYVPASYNPSHAVPLVIGLHGLGSSGANFAQYRDFRPIADTANFIMVHPDGSTMLGVRFWNYGNILGSTVDDVGFLEALIDTISAQYNINSQRIYSVGMSNGSFMSYCLACESDRFAAVAGVTGSMSVNMHNSCNPHHPTPIIHVHGTQDDTNPYEGTSTMIGIDELIEFWINQNDCNTSPNTTPVPNVNTTDNATAIRYEYTGGINGNSVELFKVIGGGHSWPNCPMPNSNEVTCMDFDARVEIWRFFSQHGSHVTSIENHSNIEMNMWPNPTQGIIHFQAPNHIITHVTVFDLHGREIEKLAMSNLQQIDISNVPAGVYLVKITGDDFDVFKKIIISKQ